MTIEGKAIELFQADGPGAPLVVLNGEDGEGALRWEAARAATGVDFSLACIGGIDWDQELTPWPAPSPFGKRSDFAGGADAYLDALTERMLPAIVSALGTKPEYVALAGYSLAGLFALYALYRTDAFARVASVSGSTWYPGFAEYALAHEMSRRPQRVYLSVGDREAKTRNAAMRSVEDNARRLYAAYRDMGLDTTFELNSGGHFDHPTQRLARAIAWMVRESLEWSYGKPCDP